MPHIQKISEDTWRLRWWETRIQPDGTTKRVHSSRPVPGHHRNVKEANRAAEPIRREIEALSRDPNSTLPLTDFIEFNFLKHIESRLRASTVGGYRRMFSDYKPFWGTTPIRSFRTIDGEQLLERIATAKDLSKNTLRNIKCFLSGIFKYAKRIGLIDSNPMQDVSLPRARAAEDTYAYTLEEIRGMLDVLPARPRAVIAVAAFTGLRKSEIAALRWEDYQEGAIFVQRAKWHNTIDEPKTEKSRAPVPVIDQLADVLESWRQSIGAPTLGWMFGTKPADLDNMDGREIVPRVACWAGWHAFRRGLATNLKRLGVPDTTIQAILRHSNVRTTQAHYIKTLNADTVAAMQKLSNVITMPVRKAG